MKRQKDSSQCGDGCTATTTTLYLCPVFFCFTTINLIESHGASPHLMSYPNTISRSSRNVVQFVVTLLLISLGEFSASISSFELNFDKQNLSTQLSINQL